MSLQLRRFVAPASFLLLLGAVASSSALWQQDPAAVDLVIEPVRGPVSVLYGRGGNIGISNGPDGMLVIDSQFDWLAPKIEAALKERQEQGPSFLVNTHVHGDHTGGNAILGKYGTIVAHTNTRGRLISERGADGDLSADDQAALPMITFDQGMSIHFNGEEVKLIHVDSAHTDTDVVVWFTGSNVVHMGDNFFAGAFPFIDTGRGGSADGLLAALHSLRVQVRPDTLLIPGHGAVCGPEELDTYIAMLEECKGRVDEALAAGKTLEEMVEMELLGDYAPTWGTGFMNAQGFLSALVESATAR